MAEAIRRRGRPRKHPPKIDPGTPELSIGVSPQALANAVDEAWFKEPEWSVQGLSNAITRAAHEAPWTDPEVTEELENAGGRLITTPAHRIPWGMATITAE